MNTLASRTIAALRTEHDDLTALVTTFTADQLDAQSGAEEWTVAQVLSHLGSGSEISLATLRAGLGEGTAPGSDFNQATWDRWNAMSPADQRAGFIEHDAALVEALEALTSEQHDSLQVTLGFLPAPLSVASVAGLRLNEVAQHSWDVRVSVYPTAGLLAVSSEVLPEHLSGALAFMLGFWGKADRIPSDVVLVIEGSGYAITITDTVSLAELPAADATATFDGPMEAALRLVTGRLRAAYTPNDVTVTGNVTLDELRAAFPGF
jgi:uncharacterized protein (TIGR03083 family)